MKKIIFLVVILAICGHFVYCGKAKPPKAEQPHIDGPSKCGCSNPDSNVVSPLAELQNSRPIKSVLKSPNASPGESSSVSPGNKKYISFNNTPTCADAPSNEDKESIFWMNKKEFFQIFNEKFRLHGPQTLQTRFLSSWARVIQNNYLMFEKIFKYGLSFGSCDINVEQSEVTEDRPIPFPDKEIIEKLQKQKDAVDKKLYELLKVLEPAYLLNEELYNMMKNNYNAKTQINQKHFDELDKESKFVNIITDRFDYVFKYFPIRTYTKHLRNIRKATSQYELGKIVRERADETLKEDLAVLDEFYPNLQNAINTATTIGLIDAQKAIIRFHALIKKVLKVDTVSSSSHSFRKMLSSLKIHRNKSKK